MLNTDHQDQLLSAGSIGTNDRALPSFSFSWKFLEQQEKTFMIIAQNDRPQGLETTWGLLKCLVF